jgi:hypothetical protein
MALITLNTARGWLRVGSEISDADLQELIDAATQNVFDFMLRPVEGDDAWPEAEVPKNVVHAVKVVLVVMYDNRDAPVIDENVLRALVGRYCITSFA